MLWELIFPSRWRSLRGDRSSPAAEPLSVVDGGGVGDDAISFHVNRFLTFLRWTASS